MDRPTMTMMDPNCCCLDCPPNSTAKLVPNPDGPGENICKCVCDSYPPECNDKKYLMTDPYGKARVWLSPRDPLKPCKGQIPAKWYEFTGEPCSCLCKDVNYEDMCGNMPDATAPVNGHGFINFPYTGKIDPRNCDCEKLCSEKCFATTMTQMTIDQIMEYAGPGSELAINGWPEGGSFNECRNPGMCCVVLDPSNIEATEECSAFCDPEQKTQCCGMRLDHIEPLRHLPNLTFCCQECEQCVGNQSFNARCEPIPGCVKSEPSVQSGPIIPIEYL